MAEIIGQSNEVSIQASEEDLATARERGLSLRELSADARREEVAKCIKHCAMKSTATKDTATFRCDKTDCPIYVDSSPYTTQRIYHTDRAAKALQSRLLRMVGLKAQIVENQRAFNIS